MTDENTLTDEQVENWRKVLSMSLGSYAHIMPKEEVQKMRDKMQEHVDKDIMIWKYEAKQNDSAIGGIECLIVLEDGSTEVLSNLGYHSPDGFQIGYGGSGPADLAYSILMDYLLRSKTCDAINVAGKTEFLHQQFKNDFIRVATQVLQVDSDDINEWLIKQEEEK